MKPKTISTKFMSEKVFNLAEKYGVSPTTLIEICVNAQWGTPLERKEAKKRLGLYK